MHTYLQIYLLLHVICFFISLGFALQKSESYSVTADSSYYFWHFLVALIIPVIHILIILGVKLHGETG
jgi:hypothetical protein